MRVYPKGCRYIVGAKGVVQKQRRTNTKCCVEALLSSFADDAFVVVQPRGKLHWWLFDRTHAGGWDRAPMLIAKSLEPDSLIMRAMLR